MKIMKNGWLKSSVIALAFGGLLSAQVMAGVLLPIKVANYTSKTLNGTVGISNGGSTTATFNPFQSTVIYDLEQTIRPTLSATFVDQTSGSLPFSCSQSYNIYTTSYTVVAIYKTAGVIGCHVIIN